MDRKGVGASSGPGSREPSPEGLGPPGFDLSRVDANILGIWVRTAIAETFGTSSLEAIDKRGSGKVYRLIPHPAWDCVGDYVLRALSDSDGSSEAGETAKTGSTEGDSAGRRHRPNPR